MKFPFPYKRSVENAIFFKNLSSNVQFSFSLNFAPSNRIRQLPNFINSFSFSFPHALK